MASDFARSYIHNDSIGNFQACKEAQDNIGDAIQSLFDLNKIMGFQIMIVENKSQETDEFIPSHEIAKGNYPYLFARIQPNENNTLDLDSWMSTNNCVKIQ